MTAYRTGGKEKERLMELRVENLTKVYGEKTALSGVSFTLERGVYGLLGPNGAGKSTLMQLITMNLKASSGEIYWNGIPIFASGAKFRSVLGYMPQEQAMYPSFTASEFLTYMAALHGMKKNSAASAADRALDAVNLSDCARQKIRTFSGGMKQRLLLAQAVVSDPEVLILDEPTAGLDPYQRVAIRNMIANMAMNKIILIATHVVQDIDVISKEILLIKDGKLIRKGSSAELRGELKGKMYEICVSPEQLEYIAKCYKIYGLRELGRNQLGVRIFAEFPPKRFPACGIDPSLEDVCLYKLGGTWDGRTNPG